MPTPRRPRARQPGAEGGAVPHAPRPRRGAASASPRRSDERAPMGSARAYADPRTFSIPIAIKRESPAGGAG